MEERSKDLKGSRVPYRHVLACLMAKSLFNKQLTDLKGVQIL